MLDSRAAWEKKIRPLCAGVGSMMKVSCGTSRGDDALYLPGDQPGPWKRREMLYTLIDIKIAQR